MNKHYPEYKRLTLDAINVIWERGVIVLDTNILLNLYRYSEATRDDILSAMEKLKDRLWMPYQVGLEYFNNRINTFTAIVDMHKSFIHNACELINSQAARLCRLFERSES